MLVENGPTPREKCLFAHRAGVGEDPINACAWAMEVDGPDAVGPTRPDHLVLARFGPTHDERQLQFPGDDNYISPMTT